MVSTIVEILYVCSYITINNVEYIDTNKCRYIENKKQMKVHERIVDNVDSIRRSSAPSIVIQNNSGNINIQSIP